MTQSPRILVVLPANLGDVIMATPVLEGIRAANPGAYLAFLVEEGFEGGAGGNPHCDEVIRFPRRAVRDALRGGGPGWLEPLREQVTALRERRFDTLINLSQHAYVSHLVPLLGAARIAGQHFLPEGNHAIDDPWSRYLYAVPFARRGNELHAVDIYRRIAGASRHRGGYTIALSDREREEAERFLADAGLTGSGRGPAVLQPGAASSAKRWPVDGFVRLGKMLADEGWSIAVAGAPMERELADAIGERIGDGCVVTAGRTSFRQAVALAACADVCVTGDTALMHAAAAFDVRVCALFGPTNPVETGPYGSGHFVLAGRCTDRPCFCRDCRSMLCMKSILPETVFACIRDGRPPQRPGCDVYRTKLEPDGDYALEGVAVSGRPYTDPSCSCLTRRAFEPDAPCVPSDPAERAAALEESRKFVDMLDGPIEALDTFLANGDKAMVHEFERRKGELSRLEGIGAFWTALLNLHLNSIALLDFRAGVAESLRACRQLQNRVRAVASD